jgi:hypothetical protein
MKVRSCDCGGCESTESICDNCGFCPECATETIRQGDGYCIHCEGKVIAYLFKTHNLLLGEITRALAALELGDTDAVRYWLSEPSDLEGEIMKPQRGAVAVCGLNHGAGLITSEQPEEVTYPDGNKGVAWTGIWIDPIEKAGDPWSSRNPKVIGFMGDMLQFYEDQ